MAPKHRKPRPGKEKEVANSQLDHRPRSNADSTNTLLGHGHGHHGQQSTEIPSKSWLRKIFQRFLFLAAVVVVFYAGNAWKPRNSSDVVMAPRTEWLKRRSGQVPCSSDYDQEKISFPGCVPKICGRVVMDSLISADEAEHLLRIAKKGLALAGSSGSASILDLHSGALSKDDTFINIFTLPAGRSIFTPQDYSIYSLVKNKILLRVSTEFGALPYSLYLTHPTFFSKMTPKEPKTQHDEYWHVHVDKETYTSFHYTSLLYLSDFDADFTGGRFVFVDKDGVNRTVEPRKGRVSMFTSGSENPHFVERVTTGERYALTVSFTCDPQHAIPDPTGTPNQRRNTS